MKHLLIIFLLVFCISLTADMRSCSQYFPVALDGDSHRSRKSIVLLILYETLRSSKFFKIRLYRNALSESKLFMNGFKPFIIQDGSAGDANQTDGCELTSSEFLTTIGEINIDRYIVELRDI